jgi:hypothetical protein
VTQTLLADGFDAALIGFGRQFNKVIAVYSYKKCVDILMQNSRMSYDEAVEYMEYNVLGAYVGSHTPVFIQEATIDDRESLQ